MKKRFEECSFTKCVLPISIIIYISLAFFETYSLFQSPGYFFLGDQGISLNLPFYLKTILEPWNFQVGSPNGATSFPVFMIVVSISRLSLSAALGEKLSLTLFFMMSGLFFFYSAVRIYEVIIGQSANLQVIFIAMVSGGIYMFNPFSLSQMLLIEIMPYYALFPLVLFMIISILNDVLKIKDVFVLFLVLLLISSAGEYGFLDGIVLILIGFLFCVIIRKSTIKLYFSRIKTNIVFVFSVITSISIWLLLSTYSIGDPFIAASYSTGYTSARLGIYGYGYDFTLIRTISLNFTQGFFNSFNNYTEIFGLIMFLLSFSGVFVKTKILPRHLIVIKKSYFFFLTLFLTSLLFLIRQFPFVIISDFVAKHFFSNGLMWEFYRNPANYAIITVFLEVFLIFLSLIMIYFSTIDIPRKTIFNRRSFTYSLLIAPRKRIYNKLRVYVVIFVLVISSSFLLSTCFNLNGFHEQVRSTVIPKAYYNANSFLINNSDAKTIVFPPTAYTHPIFTWSDGLSFPAAWPQDAFSVPQLTGSSYYSDIFVYNTYFNQLNGIIKDDYSYFRPLNVSFITVENDQLPLGYYAGNSSLRLASTLSSQNNLSRLYTNNLISLYKMPTPKSNLEVSNPMAIFGGLSNYALLADSGLNTSEFAPIFVSELNYAGIRNVLNKSSIVLLGPNQNFTTAFLEYENAYQLSIASYVKLSTNSWQRIADYNPLIQSLMVSSGKYVFSDSYVFSNQGSIYASSKGSSVSLFSSHPGSNVIFLSGISSPFSGNVTVKLGSINKTINLYNPNNVSLKWFNLDTFNSTSGKITLVNNNGTNIINSISVIPTNHYNSLFKSFLGKLSKKLILKMNYSMIQNNGTLDPHSTNNPISANIVKVAFSEISSINQTQKKINSSQLNNIYALKYTFANSKLNILNGASNLLVTYDQTFDPAWEFEGQSPIPSYFIYNGFFINISHGLIPIQFHYSLVYAFYIANYLIITITVILATATFYSFVQSIKKCKVRRS